METPRWSRLAALYAGTVFVSAFLLFQVQPLISRFILPWFGGSPAVWTTCLLFFQTALLAGYAYAHLSEHYFRPRVRLIVHLILIGAALCTLPITPSDWWKPGDSANPTGRILALLAVCVGLPYFVLSSTGPLVQAWFSQTLPGKSPYRLYSLSNLGSLLALLSYPFVVEPMLDGYAQSWWWTAGFVLFCVLSATTCWQTARLRQTTEAVDAGASVDDEPAPSWLRRLLWLLLPAFASILLLATTNHICLDVPAVPFLWVAPLSLYLLSFIIAFDHERWYWRLPYGLAAMAAIYLAAGIYNPEKWGQVWLGSAHDWIWGQSAEPWKPWVSYEVDLLCQLTGMFALCMLCHGELVRLRPKSRYLTSFYLMISAGGALGGLSVSLVAPQVFKTYAEWKIGLVAGFVLAAVLAFGLTEPSSGGRPRLRLPRVVRAGSIAVALLFLAEIVYLLRHDELSTAHILEQARNFYGVLTVTDQHPEPPAMPFRTLFHGGTSHGLQFTDPAAQSIPTAYYAEGNGISQTFRYYQQASQRSGKPLRVAVVGLGIGTLAAYVEKPGETIRFYEINPEVERLAEEYFTYLKQARQRDVTVEIVLGDARLSLEREFDQGPQSFDLLALDAFSGDSVPMHLLTKEAFEIYLRHLAPEGALIAHISNRDLDLAPVIYGLAEHYDLSAKRIFSVDVKHSGHGADYVILSRNRELLDALHQVEGSLPRDPPQPPFPLWTDQQHNLLEILR
jgi:hypothetical protein